MNLIIDLHALNSDRYTGKHHYTQQLIQQLITSFNAKQHHFHFFANKKIDFPQTSQQTWHLYSKTSYYLKLSLLTHQLKNSILLSPTSFIPTTLSSCPTITVVYDLAAWQKSAFTKNRKATLIEKALYPVIVSKSSHIITISQTIKKELTLKSPQIQDKISVIYPQLRAFPKPDHTILKQYQLQKNNYILYVGTIEPRKNLPNLIRAYHQFKSKTKNPPQLVLTGSKGWNHQETLNTIYTLNLSRHVIFIDTPTDNQLASLYQNCLFFSYIPYYEGFGLPVLEAISFKKAVLTSNTSSLPEAAGKCGLLVDPNDINQITTALTQLTTNPKLRNKFISHSKPHVKTLTFSKHISQFWQKFESLS